jgi:hypothetical protein
MLSWHFMCEPTLMGGVCPSEQGLLDLSPIVSILTYTTKRLLPGSSSTDFICPTRAVLHGTHLLLSSSCGPLHPTRAMLPGRYMQMRSSCGPLFPARALAHQRRWLPQEMPEHINLKI